MADKTHDGFWWRAELRRYASIDEWGDPVGTSRDVVWRKFAVIKQTPKGVWLTETSLGDRDPNRWLGLDPKNEFIGPWFVLGTATKQFAVPTPFLAITDCIARKERHIQGCRARLQSAEKDLARIVYERERGSHTSYALENEGAEQ